MGFGVEVNQFEHFVYAMLDFASVAPAGYAQDEGQVVGDGSVHE